MATAPVAPGGVLILGHGLGIQRISNGVRKAFDKMNRRTRVVSNDSRVLRRIDELALAFAGGGRSISEKTPIILDHCKHFQSSIHWI